jgi:hypothetical protein
VVKETDWLGHWLIPVGIRPWRKKIVSIFRMQPPTNATQVPSSLGSAQYYRDIWPKRAHILAPLTELVGRKKLKWDDRHREAFAKMKAMIVSDALLLYPDANKPSTSRSLN